ncbi:hypothetical protein [Clostridium sp. JN-1]|uniref:hypothetical protein n=1 Tax=Clostridium sp. JN-1 TaxID=2483110 RepID=UPI000F0B3966|nr:hypothetical protein [Clostridium sp. JN-1]
MSKFEKLIMKLKNNPKNARFEELEKILNILGYIMNQTNKGSSHYVFRKKGAYSITIPYAKPINQAYVKLVLEVLKNEMGE